MVQVLVLFHGCGSIGLSLLQPAVESAHQVSILDEHENAGARRPAVVAGPRPGDGLAVADGFLRPHGTAGDRVRDPVIAGGLGRRAPSERGGDSDRFHEDALVVQSGSHRHGDHREWVNIRRGARRRSVGRV